MSKTKVIICPYCGDSQPLVDRCRMCLGLFEPLSRQATHNAMGPWFVRNPNRLFQPGCSYETLVRMIERGQVVKNTIVRGPTTRQFWTIARRVPGIAHLLGYCHNCDASVDPGDHGCHACGVPFGAYLDRNFLGLPDVRPLPWEAPTIDQPRQASSARSMEWHRAAEPIGLSSFASDEDLRATAMQPAFPTGGGAPSAGAADSDGARGGLTAAVRSAGSASVLMAERASAVVQSAPPPAESSIAMRSMRRRLEQQQRTIRSLVIGLVIAGMLAIVAVGVMMSGRGDSGSASTPNDKAPSGAAKPVSPPPPPAPATQSHDAQLKDEVPTTLPSTADDQQSIPNMEEDLNQVASLIAAAAQADRPVADRVKDLEAAKHILENIGRTVPASAQPRDLKEQIKHVDAEIERLRLKEFFP